MTDNNAPITLAPINSVLVVGAGAMGSQIAMVCALAGLDTRLYDQAPGATEAAAAALRERLDSQVTRGKRRASEVTAAFDRLRAVSSLSDGALGVDLVIEAVVEKIEVKRALFAELDTRVGPGTVLASNSSSFVPSAMASAVRHPERFVNLHFFNPALVMACVELVSGPDTSPDTVARGLAFIEALGKQPVLLTREIPGFVANRLLNAVRDEAIRLLEGGYADITAIDTAARTALGHPMGPFELMDLTGIDIGYLTKQARFAETGDPADAPSATVTALVERGDLGRKTGRGFYTYETRAGD